MPWPSIKIFPALTASGASLLLNVTTPTVPAHVCLLCNQCALGVAKQALDAQWWKPGESGLAAKVVPCKLRCLVQSFGSIRAILKWAHRQSGRTRKGAIDLRASTPECVRVYHEARLSPYECQCRPAGWNCCLVISFLFTTYLFFKFPTLFSVSSPFLFTFFPISLFFSPSSLQNLPLLLSHLSSSHASYDRSLFSLPDGLATSLQDTLNGYGVCRNEIVLTHSEVLFANGCGFNILGQDCRH